MSRVHIYPCEAQSRVELFEKKLGLHILASCRMSWAAVAFPSADTGGTIMESNAGEQHNSNITHLIVWSLEIDFIWVFHTSRILPGLPWLSWPWDLISKQVNQAQQIEPKLGRTRHLCGAITATGAIAGTVTVCVLQVQV